MNDNQLTPEFFFEDVAKKTKTDVAMVREIYTLYLKRVMHLLKTEKKVLVRGLGTFQHCPRRILRVLYKFAEFLDKYPDLFIDTISSKHSLYYKDMSKTFKYLLILKPEYEYIEGSLEKLRLNHRRFEELFDNEGNCRRDFIIQDGDLQGVSI